VSKLARDGASSKLRKTVCNEIFREIVRQSRQFASRELLILAQQDVVDRLLDEESTTLAELEAQVGRPIRLQVEGAIRRRSIRCRSHLRVPNSVQGRDRAHARHERCPRRRVAGPESGRPGRGRCRGVLLYRSVCVRVDGRPGYRNIVPRSSGWSARRRVSIFASMSSVCAGAVWAGGGFPARGAGGAAALDGAAQGAGARGWI